MITPYGQSGDQLEKIMLLSIWANHLYKKQKEPKEIIFAGLGKPTYPINSHTVKSYKKYWDKLEKLANDWHNELLIDDEECAIDYGDPYGDFHAKTIMAEVMSTWYSTEILPNHVIFTVGGIGGLKIIFEVLNNLYTEYRKYRVITPFPHYSAYANNPHHMLHPIDVMSEPGYKLTASALEKSIQEAFYLSEKDGFLPKVVLICNPSNPLGTVIDKETLVEVANILREYHDLYIIFDEAYVEMTYVDISSFLHVAPDLKNRTIILRSATKALSAAGERMALILAFDEFIIHEIVRQQIITYIHPPRSSQIAYAETMLNYNKEDRQAMSNYYKQKVDYVINRLKEMGANMPSSHYQVDATFYVVGDFSDLIGMSIPKEAEHVLNKTGEVRTGEELVYALLFQDAVMLAPLSYFGLEPECGYIRITCSAKFDELEEMMDRLEYRLKKTRFLKNQLLIKEILRKIRKLEDSFLKNKLITRLKMFNDFDATCLDLKQQNKKLVCMNILIK